MEIVILVVFVIVFVLIVNYYQSKAMGTIHANKCHYFDKLQFSAQDFYDLLSAIMMDRQMPDVRISRVLHHQKHFLSNKREYLRIARKEDIFDVCAAPFGRGFFVSYWHGEPKRRIRALMMNAPYLGTAVEGWQGSTYYQIDTASMFKACVKDSIIEAMDRITALKGVRGLSEGERMALTA